MFAPWRRALEPDWTPVAVRLPGREDLRHEPRITRRDVLLPELDRQLGPLLDRPYAIYGHSLGGLVAHAFAQRQTAAGRSPRQVLIGACPPPLPRCEPALLSSADDAALLHELRRIGGLPEPVLARPALLRAVLQLTRDDLRLAADLRSADHPPLDVPLHVFAGDRDQLAGPQAMAQWAAFTTGAFECQVVAGGHFFLSTPQFPALVRRLLARLRADDTLPISLELL